MLNFLISPEIEFETKESEDFLNNKDVYYALSSESGFDLTALKKVAKNHSFSIPARINKNFFQLKSAKRVFPWQRPRRRHPRELNELAHHKEETSKMIIIPVDVYWGKAPDRQESWLRLFFRDSWEGASNIKNFLKVIFNGRQAKVYFHKPLETKDIFSSTDESPSKLILKTDRLLRARFRKHRQAKMGIDISSRRTLINSIINSKSVKNLINSNSEGDLKKKRKLMKTAEKYAYEIVSNMSYPVIYLLDKILNWFWNSRYEGLHSIGIEEVRTLSAKNSIIYAPAHKSHIDYLALSQQLYVHNLMMPQIVAGKNLNLPILGAILRNGGAFFMRRSFSKNRLYSKVFYEHIRKLFQRGSSIEYFPEGGRSRSGRLLPPKLGITSMLIRSFQDMDEKPVKFVPISMNYEKVLEGNSYFKETIGNAKKQESLAAIFKVAKDFRGYLGEAYMQFGDPIDLKSFLDANSPSWRKNIISEETNNQQWLFDVTPKLGKQIMVNINKAVVVTSSSILASAILNANKFSLSEENLSKRISLYLNLIKESEYSSKIKIPETNPEKIIAKVKKLRLIKENSNSNLVKLNRPEAAMLSFYKNNIAHLLVVDSLICGMFQLKEKITKKEIRDLFLILYPFLSEEYFLPWTQEEINNEIDKSIQRLSNNELIIVETDFIHRPDIDSEMFIETQALGRIVQRTLDRFYILMLQLWKNEEVHISKEKLEKNCRLISKNLESRHNWLLPEFSEKWTFDLFVNRLIQAKFVKKDEHGLLYPSKITKRIEEDFKNFITPEWREELFNIEQNI
jgi:glycerol-3-phosphate O-acyltransferase